MVWLISWPPITHNLTMVRFNDLTYTIPAWVQTVLLGLQLTTEEDLAPSGIDTFQRLWYSYYRRNKQTNTNGPVSSFKVPKSETKVWAITTATVPRERPKVFTQLEITWSGASFQFQFTRLFSASCGFEFFLWHFFWQKTGF